MKTTQFISIVLRWLACAALIAIMLAACAPAATPAPMPTATQVATSTSAATSTQVSSPTVVSTSTPIATASSVPTSVPARTATPSPALPPVPTGARSGNSNKKVAFFIDNLSTQTLTVYWVNFSGAEMSYGTLVPMTTYQTETFETHVWRLHDAVGKEVASYVMTGEEAQRIQIGTNGQATLWKNNNPCKLPQAAGNVGLGFPPILSRTNPVGTVRAKVLFVDFSDAPASETPQQIFARLSPGAPEFYRAVSYGRMIHQLEPHLTWLRMSKPSTDYGFQRGVSYALQRALIQETVTLADPAVDFAGAQAVYVLTNPQATAFPSGPAFNPLTANDAIRVDGTTIYRGVSSGVDMKNWGFLWLNHEVGHNMGLVDLYLEGGGTAQHQFVGDFSLMGFISGKAPEPLAYERWNLGWLDDNQIVCQPAGVQTTTLSPIETAGGVKAVVVPTGKTTAIVVESRRAIGYDNRLPKPGALVYSVDTSVKSGQGPVKVYPVIDGDAMRDQSPLGTGQSVTIVNVTIKVILSNATGDTVEVTVAK